jgi:hypothetical protein
VRQGIAVVSAAILTASLVTVARAAFDARPPLAHTGGFGEPSCRECHFDGPMGPPEALSLGWLTPEPIRPGGVYRLEVAIHDTTAVVGGFQLSVRVAAGPHAGSQAGTLCAVDARVAVAVDTTSGVQYASHAGAAPRDSLRWQVEWRAPAEDVGAVIIHVASNSANDDDSMLGDAITTRSWEFRGAGSGVRAQGVSDSVRRGCQPEARSHAGG